MFHEAIFDLLAPESMRRSLLPTAQPETSPENAALAETVLESTLSGTDPETFSTSSAVDHRNETNEWLFGQNVMDPTNTTISEQEHISSTCPHNPLYMEWDQPQGVSGTTPFSPPSTVDQDHQQDQLQGAVGSTPLSAPSTRTTSCGDYMR